MNSRSYDNDSLTAYLLGSLPETETEVFDELSITDDNFALDLKAAENDLVDAYTRGELFGEKLEKFNAYYLASPIRRQRVEFSKSFQGFALTSPSLQATPDQIPPQPAERGLLHIFKNFKNSLTFSRAAIAAVLILGLFGLTWLIFRTLDSSQKNDLAINSATPTPAIPNISTPTPAANTNNSSNGIFDPIFSGNTNLPTNSAKKTSANKSEKKEIDLPKNAPQNLPPAPVVASFVLMPPLRGNPKLPVFAIPKNASAADFKLKLESDDFAVYSAALKTSDNQILWKAANLKSFGKGESKAISAKIPAKFLKSKVYIIIVSGINSQGEREIIGEYSFKTILK